MPRRPWFRLFKRKSVSAGTVGLAFAADGVGVAIAAPDPAGSPRLSWAAFHPWSGGDPGGQLTDLATKHGFTGRTGHLVLGPGDYRLVQVAAPEVPAPEMREALRWRVQDMVDIPVDQLEIEYFPVPASRQQGGQTLVTAVVCRSSVLQGYQSWCQQAGIPLEVIDIPELAFRNVASRSADSGRGIALLHLDPARGSLQIQRDDLVYVSRDLGFGSIQIEESLERGDSGFIDRLALEIQRSLDYYESYFGMAPVAGLVIAPIAHLTQALVDRLNTLLGVLARAMDVSALIPCDQRLDDITQQRCLAAIGAVLRREAVP